MSNFDLIVVGGGPGGYVAAIRASQLGKKVALVEKQHLGGICLNWGCIPTKALLRSSEIYGLLGHLADYGLEVRDARFDLQKMVNRSRQVAGQLANGVRHLLKKNKVAVYDGHGRLAGKGQVEVRGKEGAQTITAPIVILATGARARTLPHLPADHKYIWSYREAMVPDALPARLLVIGSGAIGIEFASFYRTLGSKVTVVELQEKILPAEDAEISAFAHKSFEKQGMRILTKANVTAARLVNQAVAVTIQQQGKDSEETFDRVIVAIGIQGNIDDIGLEGTAIKADRGHIVVDGFGRTGEAGIYAIGDVVGAPWLAHKASHEGVLAVEHALGLPGLHPLDRRNIPGCTYCTPQIASVGLSEAKAREAGYTLKIGRFPFIGNGKAIALGEPEGLVKTIFDAQTGELLGAHMIGAEVTEMIQGYVLARTLEATEAELCHTIFPHPTISETMHEAVLDADGRAVHI